MEKQYSANQLRTYYDNKIYGLRSPDYWRSPSEEYYLSRIKSTIAKFLESEIDASKQVTVLDFGCGKGTDVFMLSKKFNKIKFTGADLSKKAIKLAKLTAKTLGYANCKFVEGNIETTDLKEKYDVIVCSETIEHVDINLAMDNIWRHLKEGGVLILSTPNEDYFLKRLVGILPGKFLKKIREEQDWCVKRYAHAYKSSIKTTHFSVQTYKNLLNILKNKGFKIESARRGALLYGGEWVDARPVFFTLLILLELFIPKNWLGFGSNIIIKARKYQG